MEINITGLLFILCGLIVCHKSVNSANNNNLKKDSKSLKTSKIEATIPCEHRYGTF